MRISDWSSDVCSSDLRRVQEGDPSVHGETDAFRKAGRQRRYRDTIMVTTLAPCWYCSGLVRQFNIGTVVVGESANFDGGIAWLRENGVNVIDLADERCISMLGDWIADRKGGVSGKGGSVRVDLGGRRSLKKKKKNKIKQ